MKGLFVTGTDTGVGKTLVSAALLRALRATGVDAVPMKPIQTGCRRRQEGWSAPDLEASLRGSGMTASASERVLMAPYCFGPACSPHLAAQAVGQRISLRKIRSAFDRLARIREFVVVEGAGGVLVPLDSRRTMLDLIVALELPALLVARPGLGTINHTLLSINELRRAGVRVLGVAINRTVAGRSRWIERNNCATIERMGRVPVVADLRFGESVAGAARRLMPWVQGGVADGFDR